MSKTGGREIQRLPNKYVSYQPPPASKSAGAVLFTVLPEMPRFKSTAAINR